MVGSFMLRTGRQGIKFIENKKINAQGVAVYKAYYTKG